ncbi:IS91 family transposase [Paraglaciecola sp. L3A3]|uniref:IS91 family transposase n=1 Tax=Paraglaciecola sp. L3A3 TaxID=2686358 RepID=UPI00131D46D2|nr:IS91 family transposase [Paraglaciecola sp. L3A3]
MSALHVADALQQFLPAYRQHHTLSYQQDKVCRHIVDCRTGKLGMQQWQCGSCSFDKVVYCSCRDRHCPRCQGKQTAQWVEQQQGNVLPCKYFHLVFTLPHELNVISQYAPEKLYKSLFQAVWATLSQFAISRKNLKGQLGMTAVLHTWGQTLSQHIHLHCLIPGGAMDEHAHWQSVKKAYLFPVKALSTVFRAKMLAALRACELVVPQAQMLMSKAWCVYSKPCLCQPKTVIRYLGRYTKKGMLNESRLQAISEEKVTFNYKDYADGNQHKQMTLRGEEFVRRYLSHILPKGLMRVRHFGFLANCCRRKKLEVIRRQLPDMVEQQDNEETYEPAKYWPCPACKAGVLMLTSIVLPPLNVQKIASG